MQTENIWSTVFECCWGTTDALMWKLLFLSLSLSLAFSFPCRVFSVNTSSSVSVVSILKREDDLLEQEWRLIVVNCKTWRNVSAIKIRPDESFHFYACFGFAREIWLCGGDIVAEQNSSNNQWTKLLAVVNELNVSELTSSPPWLYSGMFQDTHRWPIWPSPRGCIIC